MISGLSRIASPSVRLAQVSLATLAVALLPGTALAQQTPAPPTPAETAAPSAESIIVTGSRLSRSTFDSPQPITVLGAEQFEELQVTNVGEGIAELPAFRPSNNPSTNGFGSLMSARRSSIFAGWA